MSEDNDRVDDKEWYAVKLSFIYFFCVLASYYVMRPIREQLSAEVGSSALPIFFGGTFIATLLLTPLFSWVASRWPRNIVVPVVYAFFVVCQLLFIPLFTFEGILSAYSLGVIFFVWVSVFNLFVISVFWSFMADIWDDMQARRLFPIIALGGTAGAIIGPFLTRTLVSYIGVAALLGVSSLLLVAAMLSVILLGRWAHNHGANRFEAGNEAAIGGGMFDGLKQIFTNTFVRYISVLMLLGDAIGTIAYSLITDYSGSTFPNDAIARTRFAANIDLATNILQVIVQLTVTRWLLIKWGASYAIAIWGVLASLTCLSIVFINNPYEPIIGSLPWVALVLIITRSLSFSMLQPARETLFTLVPREIRYKGKNAVETVVWRAGDVMSSLSINALRSLGVNIAGFGVIGALLIAASGTIGCWLAVRVEDGDFENDNS